MFLKTPTHFFISSSRTLYIEVYFFIIFNLIFFNGILKFSAAQNYFPQNWGEKRMWHFEGSGSGYKYKCK